MFSRAAGRIYYVIFVSADTLEHTQLAVADGADLTLDFLFE